MLTPPWIWQKLTQEWWLLPRGDAEAFWHALALSRWSEAVALRQTLTLPGSMPLDLEHLMQEVLAPERCMKLLDNLVAEHRLARACASRIQDQLLQQMSANGTWL